MFKIRPFWLSQSSSDSGQKVWLVDMVIWYSLFFYFLLLILKKITKQLLTVIFKFTEIIV